MASQNRPLLRIKSQELLPADEDRRVEIANYDVLLPCRKFEVSYKVAVLGSVSPSLEFFLRLLKAVPGISEEDAATFFGFSEPELAYVLNEAVGPEFAERRQGRLWLTTAGDALFKDGEIEPKIFSVEDRNRSIGFDLLALAPQAPKPLDATEQWLPELPIQDGASTGNAASKISDQFSKFFHELNERGDQEQTRKRDLYSVDDVIPKERFQSLVRIKVFSQASNPSVPEIDLSSWRAAHEVADRAQIESAAAKVVGDLSTMPSALKAKEAYDTLAQLAPEFLKEFTTQTGLSVNRFWREAVGRTGEPRSDRPTVPIIGPLYCEANVRRFFSVIEYGLRDKNAPNILLWTPPQIALWGATTQLRDTLSVIRSLISKKLEPNSPEFETICLSRGKPARYLERVFDKIHQSDSPQYPASLEMLLVPNVAAVAMVHAPIGSTPGSNVPLGFATFDDAVLGRIREQIEMCIARFVQDSSELDTYHKQMLPPEVMKTSEETT
jgi:hypothetical protein